MNTYKKELEIAKQIAKKAGEIMREYFYGEQELTNKEDGSPLTIADTKVNRFVIEELSKNFNDVVIGEEESTGEYGMGRKWFCDPIDGTKAYVWGVPTAMFSLALVIDGIPVLGVAYDPFQDRLFEAVVGSGAYCNGNKLRVSQKELKGETVAVASGIKTIQSNPIYIKKLMEQDVKFAVLSGAVFKSCLVACGKLVGYIAQEDVSAHDMAAVQVIVEESGGKVTGYKGEKLDFINNFNGAVVSNGIAHNNLIDCLKP
jgi:fructose-1,6-bisphosphatase/inositol monophosphatase family enzyme